MKRSEEFSRKYLGPALLTIVAICGACDSAVKHQPSGPGPASPVQPLSADDVSLLFPAPATAAETAK